MKTRHLMSRLFMSRSATNKDVPIIDMFRFDIVEQSV